MNLLRFRLMSLSVVLRAAPLAALLGVTGTAALAEEITPVAEPALATLAPTPSPTLTPASPKPVRVMVAKGTLLRRPGSTRRQDAPKEEKKEEPAGPEPGSVTVSGLVDWYYGINMRAPRAASGAPFGGILTPSGETIAVDNFARYFDINDRDPSFALGEVNVSRTPGKGFPFGFTGTFTFGDSARLFHATEPGGTSSYSMLHNFFLTYPAKLGGKEVTVDFGKFASPFGTEVLESNLNDNYSRAFTFWYGVPFYHLGVRATLPLTNKITFQAGLVNGWNNVADDNSGKTFYTQFTIKPNPRFTQIIGWIGGPEGTGAYGPAVPTAGGGEIDTHLLDLQSIYQITPSTKIGGWLTYGSAAGTINRARISGNWLGMVAYVKHQLNDKLALGARLEQFEDFPGATAGGINGPRFGVGYLKARAFTLTLEYTALRGRMISRIEYRHDQASQQVFGVGTGGTGTDQDTLTFAQVYKF